MPSIFDPIAINGLQLPNRFVRSATYEGMADPDGDCAPRLTRMMQTLAEGRVGLIIGSHAYVRPDGQAGVGQLGIHRDDQIAGLREMTRAVHAAGGRIVAQIAHAGFFAKADLIGQPPPALTAVRKFGKRPRHVMTPADIQQLVAAFVDAGRRARAAGFDGVQIHAAHGYLLSQSLSPLFNKRTDAYGGTLVKRARMLLEVVDGLRATLGRDYPLLVKLNCADFLDGGLQPASALRVGRWLQDNGIDAIEVSGGTVVSKGLSPSRTRINRSDREAYFRTAAQQFKQTLTIPILLVGGIRSPQSAQQLLDNGVADGFAMSRPLIREPQLVRRWAGGDRRKATCVSCNRCFDAARSGEGVHCVLERMEKARGEKKSAKKG